MQSIYEKYDTTPPSNIITNSDFTGSAVRDMWYLADSNVIYPPLVEDFHVPDLANWQSRKANSFVVLGRFSQIKGQLELIRQVRKYDAQFHFIGFADRKSVYFAECEKNAATQSNVFLHPNATSDEMENILQSCRYYIHTTVNEPFGLSIIDAVSQGLLPIIHRSGGAMEIVAVPDLQYENLYQITDTLDSLSKIDLPEQYATLKQLAKHCNECFGLARFEQGWMVQLSKLRIPL